MKEDSKTIVGSAVAIFGPWMLVFGIWLAFAYLAPCGCMGGCSPVNTPNRCQVSK